jgi:hypothetical protein
MPHMSDSLVNSRFDIIFRDVRDACGEFIEVILVLAKQASAVLAGGRFFENVRRASGEALIVSQWPAHEAFDSQPLIRGQIFDLVNHPDTRISKSRLASLLAIEFNR